MLNSTEYEMCHAHNNKMSIIVDIYEHAKYNLFEFESRKKSGLVSIIVL